MSAVPKVGPDSINNWLKPRALTKVISSWRSRDLMAMVSASALRISALEAISEPPMTKRTGLLPAPLLVSKGLSAFTVEVEVTMASLCERSTATSARASSLVIHLEVPSAAATLPSIVDAIFHVIRGRSLAILVSHARLSKVASLSDNPCSTSIPDARRYSPPPAAIGFGSPTA